MSKLNKNKLSFKYKKTSQNQSSDFIFEIYKILPLLLIVGCLPFVIRLKLIPLQGPFYEFWKGEKINADFFTYYKQIFIYIVTVWALLHTFLFTKKIKFTKTYYFMGAYALLVILSTIFSKYPQIALHGFVERREGMWIILCYLLLMFSTINLVETQKQIKAIIYTLGISGAIISVISIFQYFGMDIFTTEFAKNLMISKEIQAQIKEFNIQFGEKYSYGVFYNPNYLGGYISFYAPLMLSFAIISENIRERVLFAVFFILSIFALYGSRSEAGVLGTVGAIGLLILVLTARYIIQDKPREEHKKLLLTRLAPIVLALVILPVSISYITIEDNPIAEIRREAVELFQPQKMKSIDYKNIGPVNDIKQVDNKTIKVVMNDTPIVFRIDDNLNLLVLGLDNKILWNANLKKLEEKIYMIEPQLGYDSHIKIKKLFNDSSYGIQYYIKNYSCVLYFLVDNKVLTLSNDRYFPLDINKDFAIADYIGFEGKGKLASNRGYIWSRSLPIILRNVVIGTGQDTFIAEFPQYDIYGKQGETSLNELWIITDKPHSSYVQIGIQSGLISLLLVIIGILSLQINIIKQGVENRERLLNTYVGISTLGFLIASTFNDSILAITPIFYILVGIIISEKLESNKLKVAKS